MANKRLALHPRRIPEMESRAIPATYQKNAFHSRASGGKYAARAELACCNSLRPVIRINVPSTLPCKPSPGLSPNLNGRCKRNRLFPSALEYGSRQRVSGVLLDTRSHPNRLGDRYLGGHTGDQPNTGLP
jgi:hypothetical protein